MTIIKNTHTVSKIVETKIDINLICGACGKPFKDVDQYFIYDGIKRNTFIIHPCECESKKDVK